MRKVGDVIRYKTLFGWKEGTIIDIRNNRCFDMSAYPCPAPYTETEYMIRTKRNRIRVLKSEKIF